MKLSQGDELYIQIMEDLHKHWRPYKGVTGVGQVEAGRPLINGDVNTVFIQCGRKWGKTEFAIYNLWRHALIHPGSSCYYIAPELKHGRAILWHNMRLQRFGQERDEVGRLLPGGDNPIKKYIKKINNGDCRIYLNNGSTIEIFGSENWGAANGLTPDFAVYDEFKHFKNQFHTEFNPNRIVRRAPLLIIGTPPKPGDPNKDQYLSVAEQAAERKDQLRIIAPSYENPTIPKDEIDREIEILKQRGEYDVIEREYYGKLVYGGADSIFPMFDPDRYVKKHQEIKEEIRRDIKKLEWFCVADPGTTTCFAVLFGAINPYSRKIYLMNEIYERDQHATSVRNMYPKMEALMKQNNKYSSIEDDWVKQYDEAAAWFANEVMQQYGVYFSPTQKHLNKKEEGISLIKDILLFDMVVISDNCPKLMWEMQNYVKDGNGNFPKKDDHLIDCFRYLLAAANYNMVEVLEIIRREKDNESKRYYTLEDDLDEATTARDWLHKGFGKFIKGEE